MEEKKKRGRPPKDKTKVAPPKREPKQATLKAIPSGEVKKALPAGELRELMTAYKGMRKRSGALASGYASAVATAADRYNLGTEGKMALALVQKLDMKETRQIGDFLDWLDYMLDVSGILERVEGEPKLPLDAEAETEAEATTARSTEPFPIQESVEA